MAAMLGSLIASCRRAWQQLWERFFPPPKPRLQVPNPVKDHVYVIQFHGNSSTNLSSYSPACVKLAHWLRMADIPHTLVNPYPPVFGPTGKIPFIEFNGTAIGDSSHIIEHLGAAFGKDLDKRLTPVERATALAVQRLLEEHLFFISCYFTYMDDECWPRTVRQLSEGMPNSFTAQFKHMLPSMIARIKGQGIGRMTPEMVLKRAQKDIDAVSCLLGDKKFIMGDRPCTVDATVFGSLHVAVNSGTETPVAKIIREHGNLVEYVERNLKLYWEDAAK